MKKSFFKRHSRATVLSVVFHVTLLAALTIGVRFAREPRYPPPSESVAIEATVVDESFIEREVARLEQQEQAEVLRRQEEERRAREQAEAAQRELEEQQRQLEATRAEQQRREEEARAEQQRLAELQRQREAEEQRRQEAEQQRLAQQREEEQRRREEEARRQREEQERIAREAAEARQRAEAEAELQRAMAAEEARRQAEQAGLLDQYVRLIQDRIERNWIRPGSAGPGLRCEVNVTQIPSGEVIDVRIGRCNGDQAVTRSIEQAVRRASPLPQPPTSSLFSRNLELIFEPDA